MLHVLHLPCQDKGDSWCGMQRQHHPCHKNSRECRLLPMQAATPGQAGFKVAKGLLQAKHGYSASACVLSGATAYMQDVISCMLCVFMLEPSQTEQTSVCLQHHCDAVLRITSGL